MKKILILTGTVLLAALTVMGQSTNVSEWKRYTVDDEAFSVELPVLPAMTTSKVVLLPSRQLQRRREIGAYADGVVYVIHCAENPERQSLQDYMDGIFKRQKWDRATEQEVVRDGIKGKQFRSSFNPQDVLQLFETKGNFYQFQTLSAAADNPDVDRFFSSISLGKKQKGIEVSDGIGEPYDAMSRTSDPDAAVTGKQVEKKVRLGMKPEPRYTESARQSQITGTVVLKCIFRSNGRVTDIRVVSGLPYGLTERAVESARKIKFIPATKDGRFVSMWMQLEYNFNLY